MSIRSEFKLSCVLLLGLVGFAAASPTSSPPPGIGRGLTIEGPVFTNAEGMTLYFGDGASCTSEQQASVSFAAGGGVNWKHPVAIDLPLSCVHKNPPLLARVGAQPMGQWTLINRADGTRQWAYNGRALHMSVKDKSPGEANGSYRFRVGSSEPNNRPAAVSPMPGLPAGMAVRETAAGLVFVNHTGKTLYFPDPGGELQDCGEVCEQTWQPVSAPLLAQTSTLADEWTIMTRPGGIRQWAYKGQPVYTYAFDAEGHGGQLFGDTFGSTWGPAIKGWHIAMAKPAPPHPAGITIQQLPGSWEQFNTPLPGLVYADTQGRTLYTIHCRQGRGVGLTCDDIGDDARYWLSYCGGEARCAKTWRPLAAPRNTRPTDGVWSVVVIDPRHPFRPVERGKGVRAWAYRGRPVFTYAHDKLPGDYYGDDQGFAISGDGMQARPIAAYGRSSEARKPVMALGKN